MLDARLTWENPRRSIFLEGNNLLDTVYYDHGNIPQPGFWFRIGATFRILERL